MRKNIEATILSSFIDDEIYMLDGDNYFTLDEDVFSWEAFKYFARNINKFVAADKPLSLLREKLEETVAGTAYEFDYFFMVGRVNIGMGIAEKYYADLVVTHRKELAKGML